LNDTGESAGKSSGRHVWDLQNTRMDSHAVQYSNLSSVFSSGNYRITLPIPKFIFKKRYPKNPANFGDRLRIIRMDAGLQIKELAKVIDVTEDTIINWEMRSVSPTSNNLKKIMKWISDTVN
jgi:DNA-binding transcriptional regulator YiaG